jgi:ankyrin repeat protein
MLSFKKSTSFSLVTTLCLFALISVLVFSFIGHTHAMEDEPDNKKGPTDLFEVEKLPKYVLRKVFNKLPLKDIYNLASTNKLLFKEGKEAIISQLLDLLKEPQFSTAEALVSHVQPKLGPKLEPEDAQFMELLGSLKMLSRKELPNALQTLPGPQIKMMLQRLKFIKNYKRILATLPNDSELRAFLQNVGTNVNARDYASRTALILASETGQLETARLLLESGARVDLQDRYGSTALMLASSQGHTEVVELLLKHNARVDLQDIQVSTALMLASSKGHTKVVELLLKAGADANLQDINKKTALDMARDRRMDTVVELLMSHNSFAERGSCNIP